MREFNFDNLPEGEQFEDQMENLNEDLKSAFNIDLKQNLLFSSLMMGEPYLDGNANGRWDDGEPYYDHDADGVFDRGSLGFKEFTNETYTVTTNVNGTFPLPPIKVPNIYNIHAYEVQIGSFTDLVSDALTDLNRGDVTATVDEIFTTAAEGISKRLVNLAFSILYDDTRIDEPAFDRNNNGIIDFGDTLVTDNNQNCSYDEDDGDSYIDVNNNGRYDSPEFADINCDGLPTLAGYDGEYYEDLNGNGRRDNGELFFDTNNNGEFDSGEPYWDENGNGSFDGDAEPFVDGAGGPADGYYNGPVTVRTLLTYGGRQYREVYSGLKDRKIPQVAARAIDELLNPDSPSYITERMIDARKRFTASVDFKARDLRAFKNVIGSALYDRNAQEYTYLVSNAARHVPDILLQFEGQYDNLIDLGIYGFSNDRLMAFLLGEMYPQEPFRSIDVLHELKFLARHHAMRCYPGKPLPACDEYGPYESFWGATAQLMSESAVLVYRNKEMDWQAPNPLYDSFFANLE